MNLDAFKTTDSSPPKPEYPPECRMIGCGPLTHTHNPWRDFLVAEHGTIFLLQPITGRASAWFRGSVLNPEEHAVRQSSAGEATRVP